MNFFMPTNVIFGYDCVICNASLLGAYGKKAFIVTGRHSSKLNGSLDDLISSLNISGTKYFIYNQILANPSISDMFSGAKTLVNEDCDFIVAIGGGSAMDAAKAINYISCNNPTVITLFDGNDTSQLMPMAFIPTTSGTGSEVTPYSVLTDNSIESKITLASKKLFPTISLLDPKYTKTLSREVSINTAIDALSHSIEGMISVRASELTDSLARRSISLIFDCAEPLKNGILLEIHLEKLMMASLLAGIVIANTGTTAVHPMGYHLTYHLNIDHGRANGLLLSEFLRFVSNHNKSLSNDILSCCNLSCVDEFKEIIDLLLGIREQPALQQLEKFSQRASTAKNIRNSKVVPNYEDILGIYRKSFNI